MPRGKRQVWPGQKPRWVSDSSFPLRHSYVHLCSLQVHPSQHALEGGIHPVIAADIPPELGALHILRAGLIALPVVVRKTAYNAADLWIIVTIRVEEAPLF